MAIALKIITSEAHAVDDRDLDLLIQNDREARIEKINQMTIDLNKSLVVVQKLKSDLEKEVLKEKQSHTINLVIKDGSMATAAIGVISTIIYQTLRQNPSKLLLAGGYSLSTLAAFIAYSENHSILLSRAEIDSLIIALKQLEDKTEIEKRNLAREIRLLCLSDGGSVETCDSLN